MKILDVVEAKYLGGHRIWLRFNDGVEGEIDLADKLQDEIFEPLRDLAYFATFTVRNTLTWPNGADFAPEYLHEHISARTSTRVKRRS